MEVLTAGIDLRLNDIRLKDYQPKQLQYINICVGFIWSIFFDTVYF